MSDSLLINDDLAIIGMDVFFPGCENLIKLEHIIFKGISISKHNSIFSHKTKCDYHNLLDDQIIKDHWNWLSKENNNIGEDGKILEDISIKESSLLKVISGAQHDAQIAANCTNLQNQALVYSFGESEPTTNTIFDRFKSHKINKIDRLNPITINDLFISNSSLFPIPIKTTMLYESLCKSTDLLCNGVFDVVIIASITCTQTDSKHSQTIENSYPTDINYKNTHKSNLNIAAAAIVITKYTNAVRNNYHIYSLVKDIKNDLVISDLLKKRVGYLEIIPNNLDRNYVSNILKTFKGQDAKVCAIGSVYENVGFKGITTEIISLIKTSLLIKRRTIPSSMPDSLINGNYYLTNTPFYLPGESRPWFIKDGCPPRQAVICTDINKFVYLSEDDNYGYIKPLSAIYHGFFLFPFGANSQEELLDALADFQKKVVRCDDLFQLSSSVYEKYIQDNTSRFCIAIVGGNKTEIERDINFAIKGVPEAFDKGTFWQSPQGSYFTPRPLNNQGKIAFVYSGAFNSYIGFGNNLFYLFPSLYDSMSKISSDIGMVLQETKLYPRGSTRGSKDQLEPLDINLSMDPIAMLSTGTGFASLYTMVLRDIFKVIPDIGFGYSLGENSMLFAMGIWTQGDDVYKKLKDSPLFHTQIAGPQITIRNYWRLGSQDKQDTNKPLWSNYVLLTTPENVKEALLNEKKVFLTHINTSRQVVIGGDEHACMKVISQLNCMFVKAPYHYVLHCEPMQAEFDRIADLHTWPVESNPEVTLYTAATYEPFQFCPEIIANNIATALCCPLDFPRLVERTYLDGARIYIEIGAGSNCSKWVDAILSDKTHVSIPINRSNCDDHVSIIRLMAILLSHQVKPDVSSIFK